MSLIDEIINSARKYLLGGEISKARVLLLEELKHHSNSIPLLQILGDVEVELGNHEAAWQHFSKLVSLSPDSSEVWVNFALLNLKLGRMVEYRTALARALQIDPKIESTLHALVEENQKPDHSFVVSTFLQRTTIEAAKTSFPIVILQLSHRGYLGSVLDQARTSNSEVVLIADKFDPSLEGRAEFADMEQYHGQANHFCTLYTHLSTNSFAAELFCFTRWFILKEYMEVRGLQVCMHIDSDVLLFVNAAKEFLDNFAEYELTLINGTVGCTSFLTYEGLTRFCTFLQRVYENKAGFHFQSLLNFHKQCVEAGAEGGVCDMTLLDLYRKESGAKIGEMTDVLSNCTYDHNFNTSDGYEMGEAGKRVYPHNGFPYCKRLVDGAFIRFNSLHFQGRAKGALNHVAEGIRQSMANPSANANKLNQTNLLK